MQQKETLASLNLIKIDSVWVFNQWKFIMAAKLSFFKKNIDFKMWKPLYLYKIAYFSDHAIECTELSWMESFLESLEIRVTGDMQLY